MVGIRKYLEGEKNHTKKIRCDMFSVLKWMRDAFALCNSKEYTALIVQSCCMLVAKVMPRGLAYKQCSQSSPNYKQLVVLLCVWLCNSWHLEGIQWLSSSDELSW